MAENLAFKGKLVWFGLDWFSLVWFVFLWSDSLDYVRHSIEYRLYKLDSMLFPVLRSGKWMRREKY